MPDVDGIEILQELKAFEPKLPIIMMTAVKTVRTSVAAMKLGASDYVTKPFQEEELIATVRRALQEKATQSTESVHRCYNREMQFPQTHRLLIVGGELGWRATLAVTLARACAVETSA